MRLLSHKPVESIELSVFPSRARRGSQFPMTQSCQRRQGGGVALVRSLCLLLFSPGSPASGHGLASGEVGFGLG